MSRTQSNIIAQQAACFCRRLAFWLISETYPWGENGVHGHNWIFGCLESLRSYLVSVGFWILFFGGF